MDDDILYPVVLEEYYIKMIKPLVSQEDKNVQIGSTSIGHGFVIFYGVATSNDNNIIKTHTLI